MADDLGWAQTSYYGHPLVKTPNLDDMASSGLRLDRFYAGAPSCTPTRATVLTGRTNDRTGAARMRLELDAWNASVDRSMTGADYPEDRMLPSGREPANS